MVARRRVPGRTEGPRRAHRRVSAARCEVKGHMAGVAGSVRAVDRTAPAQSSGSRHLRNAIRPRYGASCSSHPRPVARCEVALDQSPRGGASPPFFPLPVDGVGAARPQEELAHIAVRQAESRHQCAATTITPAGNRNPQRTHPRPSTPALSSPHPTTLTPRELPSQRNGADAELDAERPAVPRVRRCPARRRIGS